MDCTYIYIVLTIIIKISAKPSFYTLGFVDYLDFGFDLSISAIILLLTGINSNAFFYVNYVNINNSEQIGLEKGSEQINYNGVLIPDAVGIILLVISTLYV